MKDNITILEMRSGRIIVSKINSKVVLGKYLRSKGTVPNPLRAILNLEFIWLIKDNCLSKIIPRCLCLVISGLKCKLH